MSIILLAGPTGVGKSSIVDYLLRFSVRYVRPTAYTTRPQREGESPRQFLHVSAEEIQRLQLGGQLLTFDEVHGYFYGISKQAFEALSFAGQIAIKEFYAGDHAKFKLAYPKAISVLLMPRSDSDYLLHVRANPEVRGRLACRPRMELADHTEFGKTEVVDIVIYNDFKEPISRIAENLHEILIKHLSSSP